MSEQTGVRMGRERFYAEFGDFVLALKPDRERPAPSPDTHLWEAGYLDSFAMLEVVARLEETIGRDIELGPDALPSFYTLERIYDSYLAGGAA